MEPEALARHRINTTLAYLGWRFEDDSESGLRANVRFEGHFRNPSIARGLGRRRPDYHLYQDDSDIPIALIEAKKPQHRRLSDGLEQAREYAKAFGNKDMLIFCSDGTVTMAEHVGAHRIPTIDGEMVQGLLPPDSVQQLAANPDLSMGKSVQNVQELVRIFTSSQDKLRADGVETGMVSLREFCMLLFVKIMMERDLRNKKWDNFVAKRGQELLDLYKNILSNYQRQYPDVIREVSIRNPKTLEGLVDEIKKIHLTNTQIDIKGGAYEHFLSRYNMDRQSVLGQFFTPRHITRMISQLLDPRLGDTVYDPFCGTGGMLVACYDLLHNQVRNGRHRKKDEETLNTKTLFGTDLSAQAAQIAKMNMILLGDGHSNIGLRDSLSNQPRQQYNHVVTNIPFNMQQIPDPARYKEFPGATNGNILATLHCLHAVKPGGKAAIILPENMAYDPRYSQLRCFIRDNARIHAVIRFPRPLFIQYTTARTCLLLLDKVWQSSTKKFPYLELSKDGFSSSRLREPIGSNQIPELLETPDISSLEWAQETWVANDDESKFFGGNGSTRGKGNGKWQLGDLLDVRRSRIPIDPRAFYAQPHIHSANNTVSVLGEPRMGRNISNWERGRVIAQPGDLIISTLHTQSGNGLFAIANREYMISSQIVAKIREDLVNKEYLLLAMRKALPTLTTNDLVGRENYSRRQILSLPIPYPPADWEKRKRRAKEIKNEIEALQDALKKLEKL